MTDEVNEMNGFIRDIMMEIEEELSESIPEEEEISSWHHFSDDFLKKIQNEVLKKKDK